MDVTKAVESAWISLDRAKILVQQVEIKADKSNLQYMMAAIDAMEESAKYLEGIINYSKKEVVSDGSGT